MVYSYQEINTARYANAEARGVNPSRDDLQSGLFDATPGSNFPNPPLTFGLGPDILTGAKVAQPSRRPGTRYGQAGPWR